jgi:hypothetical protein
VDLLWGSIIPPDPQYGYGALDAYSAVTAALTGDLNSSGVCDTLDLELLVDYVGNPHSGNRPPVSRTRADVNCDGKVDLSDIAILIDYLLGDGEPPEPCSY